MNRGACIITYTIFWGGFRNYYKQNIPQSPSQVIKAPTLVCFLEGYSYLLEGSRVSPECIRAFCF